jgi:hypothetical protein
LKRQKQSRFLLLRVNINRLKDNLNTFGLLSLDDNRVLNFERLFCPLLGTNIWLDNPSLIGDVLN